MPSAISADIYRNDSLSSTKFIIHEKGFWNYSEEITYRVLRVRLMGVANPPAHWQNAFKGEIHQAIEVTRKSDGCMFLMDNNDGSAFHKILARGGPNKSSWHIGLDAWEFICEEADETAISLNPIVSIEMRDRSDAWVKENHPEIWAQLQELKKAWAESPMKKLVDESRRR